MRIFESVKKSFFLQKIFKASLLNDPAFFYYENYSAFLNRLESMSDCYWNFAFHQSIESKLYYLFVLIIKSTSRLIEQINDRVSQNRTSNGNSLFLPSRELCSLRSDLSFKIVTSKPSSISALNCLKYLMFFRKSIVIEIFENSCFK